MTTKDEALKALHEASLSNTLKVSNYIQNYLRGLKKYEKTKINYW